MLLYADFCDKYSEEKLEFYFFGKGIKFKNRYIYI